jgi:hypothetical protein
MFSFIIFFFILFILELRFLKLKYKKDKYIWIGIVFIFGYFGYFYFLINKRRRIVKRKFELKTNRID